MSDESNPPLSVQTGTQPTATAELLASMRKQHEDHELFMEQSRRRSARMEWGMWIIVGCVVVMAVFYVLRITGFA